MVGFRQSSLLQSVYSLLSDMSRERRSFPKVLSPQREYKAPSIADPLIVCFEFIEYNSIRKLA
jgi:hypothetical protein